jgi:adenylylsulfate kinase-like enzyme
MADKPTIVEATGSATAGKSASAREIEKAMAEAIEQALAEGVTDPDEIRERQLEARRKVIRGE